MMRWLHFTLFLLALNGCASKLPSAISEPPAEPVSVQEVQKQPQAYLSRKVRWGGEVIEVENDQEHSDVLVLGRELKKKGEPRENGAVDGRFIARFGGFMDPAELAEGSRITVSGPVIGLETRVALLLFLSLLGTSLGLSLLVVNKDENRAYDCNPDAFHLVGRLPEQRRPDVFRAHPFAALCYR